MGNVYLSSSYLWTPRRFWGKAYTGISVFGIFFGPSQISKTSEFGLPDRKNWRDFPPQSRNSLPTFCFHGNDGPLLSLFRLVGVRISIKGIFTFKDFNCTALSILSGWEHFSLRELLPVSRKFFSSGFVKINYRCQVAQNFHESGLC